MLLLACAELAAAQARIITGKVTDTETGQPLGGAQVFIKAEPTRGITVRGDGTFSLPAPSVSAVLVVRWIGYSVREVVIDTAIRNVDVTMQRDPLKLDEVVVTGQASSISRRNLANSIVTVSAEDLTRVPSPSIENALQGKVPGAQIQTNTGAPGGGNRIRIRGTSSILGNSRPLFVVDGAIVSDESIAQGTNHVTFAGGGMADASQESPDNRIVDLNPEDIETIEVLKGSAVAAMYGSKASAGVIMITTKRGRAGKRNFELRTGLGTSTLSYRNHSRRFPTLAAARATFDPNNAQGDAWWNQNFAPDSYYDYEQLLFGKRSISHETNLSLNGGSDNNRYFASALIKRDDGIVKNTFADKKSLRINFDHDFGTRLALNIGSQVVRNATDRGLFGNSNTSDGDNTVSLNAAETPSFLDLRRRADNTYPDSPFHGSNPFQTIDLVRNRETTWRNVNTASLTATLLHGSSQELRLVANGGVDVFTQRNNVLAPPELQFAATTANPGTAVTSYTQSTHYNVNLNMVHVYRPLGWLALTSQAGTQHEVSQGEISRARGWGFLGGIAPTPSSGTLRDIEGSKWNEYDFGLFAQTEALISERLLLTAGMRADRSSNNAHISKFFLFPKFAMSYRFAQLDLGPLSELKARLAYGETGNRPLYGQKFTSLTQNQIGGLAGLTLAAARGAPDIRPERQRELEGGVDLLFVENRAQLELTSFQRNVSGLIVRRNVAPSQGFSSEIYNGASMRVTGFEAALNAFPIRSSSANGVAWNARLSYAANRDRVTKLPVPPFVIGSSTPNGRVSISEGRSVTQLIGNDTVAVDGVCPPHAVDPGSCGALKAGATVPVYLGVGNPKFTAGLSNEVRWRGFGLYALLDRQKGGMLRAGTFQVYDGWGTARDFDEPSPDPAKTLGLYRRDVGSKVTRTYYLDASYLKLREVSLTYDIPARYSSLLFRGAGVARLSLSGRNLKTWTSFRGSDPEFSNFGGAPEAVQLNREYGAYPPSRSFWLNLHIGF